MPCDVCGRLGAEDGLCVALLEREQLLSWGLEHLLPVGGGGRPPRRESSQTPSLPWRKEHLMSYYAFTRLLLLLSINFLTALLLLLFCS